MKNQQPNDEQPNNEPTGKFQNTKKQNNLTKALTAMSTSYENTFPVGEAIGREEILEEQREKELLRQKYAPHLNKS